MTEKNKKQEWLTVRVEIRDGVTRRFLKPKKKCCEINCGENLKMSGLE